MCRRQIILRLFLCSERGSLRHTRYTPIPWDKERLNVGGAMNSRTRKFTAPRAGIYAFSFDGDAIFPPSSSIVYLYLQMRLNDNAIGYGEASKLSSKEVLYNPKGFHFKRHSIYKREINFGYISVLCQRRQS